MHTYIFFFSGSLMNECISMEQVSLLYHCLKYAIAQFVSDDLPSGLDSRKGNASPAQFSQAHRVLCTNWLLLHSPLIPMSYEV